MEMLEWPRRPGRTWATVDTRDSPPGVDQPEIYRGEHLQPPLLQTEAQAGQEPGADVDLARRSIRTDRHGQVV